MARTKFSMRQFDQGITVSPHIGAALKTRKRQTARKTTGGLAPKQTAKKSTGGLTPRKQLERKNNLGAAGGCANLVGTVVSEQEHIDPTMPPPLIAALQLINHANGWSSYTHLCRMLESLALLSSDNSYVHLHPVAWWDSSARATGSHYTRQMAPEQLKFLQDAHPGTLLGEHCHLYLSIFDTFDSASRVFGDSKAMIGFFLITAPTGNWVQEVGNLWPGRHCYGLAIRRKEAGGNDLYIFEPDAAEPKDEKPALRSFGAIQVIPKKLVQPRGEATRRTGRFTPSRVFVRQVGREEVSRDGRCVARTLEWLGYAIQNARHQLVDKRSDWFWEVKDLSR
ncbi:hypothetical protein C8F01DRAFT_1115630 [Mycena amicta]|nr:hypothetical protein C8F01DRAFT_1115630 [Mycena amicta]